MTTNTAYARDAIGTNYRSTSIGRVSAIILFLLVTVLTSVQASPPVSQDIKLEQLTQAVTAMSLEYRLASEETRAVSFAKLKSVMAARRLRLGTIVKANPSEVLRVTLPPKQRDALPGALKEYAEEETDLQGEIEVLAIDHKDSEKSHFRYFLKTTSGKRFSLHFSKQAPEVISGTVARAHGTLLRGVGPQDFGETAGAMAVQDGSQNLETLALTGSTTSSVTSTVALPNTIGEQKTLVILVNFQDKATQPYTADFARNVVFTSTSNYDLENSFQQTWLSGDVAGWFTIPASSTTCDYVSIASYAKSAATAAGFNLSAYTRYVYAFPKNACGWWGLGTVGGNPSQAWINGSIALKVVSHEMGHNFGLYHAHSLECGTATLSGSCTSNDYGDTIDSMGSSATGHFSAFAKERLGWLNNGVSPTITTVQATGDYWLDPYAAGAGANAKALKILKGSDPNTGKKTWYYVEYRQAVGFDGFLSSNANVLNGVVVRTGSESGGSTSNLLDMTPTSPTSFTTPALTLGQSYYDPEAGVTITPAWMNGSNAIVNVAFGSLACVRTNPTLSLAPGQSQWVQPGMAASFTLTVTNKDNSACSASVFDFGAVLPSGWTGAFAQSSISIAPGASVSTTLTVYSPGAATDGFYNIPVSVANAGQTSFSASVASTVVIVKSLAVTAATDKAIYSRNQSVFVTAMVSANGSAVASAPVSFTFIRPNGSKVVLNATTDANGRASASVRISRKDPAGAYQVQAMASVNGVAGSASTSFTVQ